MLRHAHIIRGIRKNRHQNSVAEVVSNNRRTYNLEVTICEEIRPIGLRSYLFLRQLLIDFRNILALRFMPDHVFFFSFSRCILVADQSEALGFSGPISLSIEYLAGVVF